MKLVIEKNRSLFVVSDIEQAKEVLGNTVLSDEEEAKLLANFIGGYPVPITLKGGTKIYTAIGDNIKEQIQKVETGHAKIVAAVREYVETSYYNVELVLRNRTQGEIIRRTVTMAIMAANDIDAVRKFAANTADALAECGEEIVEVLDLSSRRQEVNDK